MPKCYVVFSWTSPGDRARKIDVEVKPIYQNMISPVPWFALTHPILEILLTNRVKKENFVSFMLGQPRSAATSIISINPSCRSACLIEDGKDQQDLL